MKVGIVSYSSICERKFIPALLNHSSVDSITVATSKNLKNTDNINFVDYKTFFENSYDWVYISSIPSKNFQYTKECLSKGWHVLCEKPSFISPNNYSELLEISKKNKLLFVENYSHLFHPRYNTLKNKVDRNIDKIKFVDFKFFYPAPQNLKNFRYHESLGGGVQFDSLGYLVTAYEFFFGAINKNIEYDLSFTKNNNVVNMLSLSFQSKNKIINLSTGIDLQYDASLSFYGKDIKISLEKAFAIDRNEKSSIIVESGFDTVDFTVDPSDQFFNIIDNFISIINIDSFSENNHYKEYYDIYDKRASLLTKFYKKIK